MVPESVRGQVMDLSHDSLLGGHLCVKKIADGILANFYWPVIRADVSRYCRSCDICQRMVKRDL